ncbi:MAG: T9SS type A sorting domain-containing protein, partial [Bacteroidetes bacterium]|nr:T9SS type A sorting domain-containing protein [Bacteroidota bacterium]
IYTLNSEISVGGSQTTWLKNDLESNTQQRWKIAQYHRPMMPHTTSKVDRLDIKSNWEPLFYSHGVKLVVESDAHLAKSTYPIKQSTSSGNDQGFIRDNERGVTYIGEGCWGAPLRTPNHNKNWTRNSDRFNHFTLIFVGQDKIEVRYIKVDNASSVGTVNDSNVFSLPTNIDVWSPSNGPVVNVYPNSNAAIAPGITPGGSTTFCSGGNVQLMATTGTGYSYQWKKDGANIIGATGSTYSATATGNYTVSITSNGKTYASSATNVNVTTGIIATVTPAGPTTFYNGNNVILNANTGQGHVYQWIKDNVDIAGANGASYTATTSGNYKVRISKEGCINVSQQTTITTQTLTATISADGPTTFCDGDSVLMNANTGNGFTYQWKRNGTNISGATAAFHTAYDAGNYTVEIKVIAALSTSQAILVTKDPAIIATITASGPTTNGIDSIVLSANTGAGFEYQWYNAAGAIQGEKADFYVVYNSGNYQVKIKSNTCEAVSDWMEVIVNSLTGINRQDNGQSKLTLYPNPTNGQFNIKFESVVLLDNDVSITINNSIGQVVYHEKSQLRAGTYNKTINPDLAEGIYILQIQIGEEKFIKKFMVNQ